MKQTITLAANQINGVFEISNVNAIDAIQLDSTEFCRLVPQLDKYPNITISTIFHIGTAKSLCDYLNGIYFKHLDIVNNLTVERFFPNITHYSSESVYVSMDKDSSGDYVSVVDLIDVLTKIKDSPTIKQDLKNLIDNLNKE